MADRKVPFNSECEHEYRRHVLHCEVRDDVPLTQNRLVQHGGHVRVVNLVHNVHQQEAQVCDGEGGEIETRAMAHLWLQPDEQRHAVANDANQPPDRGQHSWRPYYSWNVTLQEFYFWHVVPLQVVLTCGTVEETRCRVVDTVQGRPIDSVGYVHDATRSRSLETNRWNELRTRWIDGNQLVFTGSVCMLWGIVAHSRINKIKNRKSYQYTLFKYNESLNAHRHP